MSSLGNRALSGRPAATAAPRTGEASDVAEPTPEALAEIDAEWPLIAAELDLLDAEIAAITAGFAPSALDRRRVRRAEHRVMTVSRELAAERTPVDGREVA